jgi:hypothetical protein
MREFLTGIGPLCLTIDLPDMELLQEMFLAHSRRSTVGAEPEASTGDNF